MPNLTITIPERLLPALGLLCEKGREKIEELSRQGLIDQLAFDRAQTVREFIEAGIKFDP